MNREHFEALAKLAKDIADRSREPLELAIFLMFEAAFNEVVASLPSDTPKGSEPQ